MMRSKELQKESLNDVAVFVFLRREVSQDTYPLILVFHGYEIKYNYACKLSL